MMGRPERHDVDYFPFYIKDGKTLFILESKFGCKGTGFFTNLMRFLSRTPDHYFQVKNESDRLYFYATLKCDDISGAEMMLILSETGKIDKELWINHKIIVSPDLLDSLKSAYSKRSNPIISISEIRKRVVSENTNQVSAPEIPVSGGKKPQSKVKESKGKESKVNIPEFLKEIWPSFVEMRKKIKKPLTDKAIELTIAELEKLYPDWPTKQIECIEQSIQRGWQGVFKINHNYGKQEKPVGTKFANLKETVIS